MGVHPPTKPSIVGTAPCRNSCEPSYVPRAGKLKQSDGGGVSCFGGRPEKPPAEAEEKVPLEEALSQ